MAPRLLARAGVHLARARLALLLRPPGELIKFLPPLAAEPLFCAPDAARAVEALARRFPGSRCLDRALALRALLREGGHAAVLRLGVAKRGDGSLAAHAWVVCGELTFDCGESVGGYASLAAGEAE